MRVFSGQIFNHAILLLILASASLAQATTPVLIIDNQNQLYDTRGYLEYWIPPREMPIDQQLAAIDGAPFQTFTAERLPAQQRDIWFRLKIQNKIAEPLRNYLAFDDFLYDRIATYHRNTEGKWEGIESGLLYPYAQRDVNYRYFSFPILSHTEGVGELVFRVNSLQARPFLPTVQPGRVFFKFAIINTVISAAIIGFTIGTLFYMLQLGGLRWHAQLTPLYFFLLVALLVMLYYSGFIYRWIPEHAALHRNLVVLLNSLLMYSGIMLARKLFDIEQSLPWTRYLIWLYFSAIVAVAAGTLLIGPEPFVIITNLYLVPLGTLSLMLAGIYGLYRRASYALKFLTGVTLYFLINNTIANKIIYLGDMRWDTHILEISTGVLVLFLASTVASRIRIEHGRLEQAEQQAKISSATSDAKSQFITTMSHEIRTPMNGVLGMAQLLEQTNLDNVQRNYTQTIMTTGKMLLGIINDILDFAKIESGKLSLENTEINLDQMLSETANLFWKMVSDNNVEFFLAMNSNVPINIYGDAVRLQQVLNNLVSNASKFTEHGKIVVAVEVVSQHDDNVVLEFSVIDTGIGINEAVQRTLFQAYTQADASTTRRYGGTGLGLAICQKLIELMHGTIGVDSQPGQGSRFWFRVPLTINQVKEQALHAELQQLQGKHIGLALSHHHIAEYYAKRLKAIGAIPHILDTLADNQALSETYGNHLDVLICSNLSWHKKASIINPWRQKNVPTVRIVVAQTGSDRDSSSGTYNVSGNLGISDVLKVCLQAIRNEQQTLIPSQNSAPDLSSLHLLIAEDNPVNLQLLIALFKRLNITHSCASNGLDAVTLYKSNPEVFSAILMDCEMPEMDGFMATQEIRRYEQDNNLPRLPIFALTAHALGDIAQRCEAAGMDKTLTKPINLQELTQLLQTLLDEKS